MAHLRHEKQCEEEEDGQTVTRTICSYCGVGCNLDLHVQDNRIVKVTSPMDHSVTSGHLCIKGRFGYEYVQELGDLAVTPIDQILRRARIDDRGRRRRSEPRA